jgi:hypothetical protein
VCSSDLAVVDRHADQVAAMLTNIESLTAHFEAPYDLIWIYIFYDLLLNIIWAGKKFNKNNVKNMGAHIARYYIPI